MLSVGLDCKDKVNAGPRWRWQVAPIHAVRVLVIPNTSGGTDYMVPYASKRDNNKRRIPAMLW